MDQNIDFFGSDQIQTPQYPKIHPPSQEISDEVFQAKGDLMKSIQTFLEEFNYIPFGEKPKILLEAWYNFFTIRHAQPEDSNELFQKLLEDLKELAEYKEYLENSSKEIATSNSNQEKEGPPQDSDICQLIREECCIEVCEEQKQNMEDTILELVEICHQKELLCMHDNEVKNVVEQPAERRTQEPEHSLSMGYEHLSTTPETEYDEGTESSAKNLLPIPSECEVTSEDESECDMPAKDDSSRAFTTFSNPLFNDNDDLDSSDDESLPDEVVPTEEFKIYSNPFFDDDEINSDKLDPHCFNVESDFVESLLNHDTFIDYSPKFDFLLKEFSGELAHIDPVLSEIEEADFDFEEEIRLIENLLYDNSSPRPPEELNAEIADTIIESFPSSLIPDQDNDSQRKEIDIVTNTDELLPPDFENDDSEREIDVVEELHVDNSISNSENELSDNEKFDFDNPSFPRPPPKPPDDKFDFEPDSGEEISDVMNDNDELECLDLRDEFDDDDYSSFMFLIYSKVFSFLLSAESEDTIFDPGISV
uniref:Reverse transcriptase domain-containing protein n=1 Tax=Tanacetum cinerariifolium TaxID=118510 RepID=A0A699JAJ7_TANCI|nr:hypothetical protein [Tanacetum cinerariifolium]